MVSTPVMHAMDYLVADGDGLLVHYRRHGSWRGAQAYCDAAVPGLASWEAGRRAWGGAQYRKHRHGAVPVYIDGGLYEHRPAVIPDEVLDVVGRIGWTPGLTGTNAVWLGDHFGQGGQRLVPRVERLLTDTADTMFADHQFAFDVEPCTIACLTCRCPDGTSPYDDHVHDDSHDPWRRWVSLVMYFTDPSEYEGGDLVIVPTGERLRPGRGDVVFVRGDVEHRVEPIATGRRVTFNAWTAEPRWWLDQPGGVEVAGFAGERCRLVDRLWREGKLTVPTLRHWLALAWNHSEWPEESLPATSWVAMFRAAGYLTNRDDLNAPTESVTVWRACDPGRERRLTWTSTPDTARMFGDHWERPELWRATVPPEAVLAWFELEPGHTEVVVDPSYLDAPGATPERIACGENGSGCLI